MATDHTHPSQQHANYCIRCGTPLESARAGPDAARRCPACGWIAHMDPKVAAGALVLRQDRLLLVRRRYRPARGRWSLPGGFVNAGEHPRQATERECLEETGVTIECGDLIELLVGEGQPGAADLFLLYQATWLDGDPRPSDDVDGAQFFAPGALPELAFQSTRLAVRRWLGDS